MQTSQLRNNDKSVANHIVRTVGTTSELQSYDTIVAKLSGGNVYLDAAAWALSPTTLKYVKVFLGTTVSKATIMKRIANGEYILTNLNNGE